MNDLADFLGDFFAPPEPDPPKREAPVSVAGGEMGDFLDLVPHARLGPKVTKVDDASQVNIEGEKIREVVTSYFDQVNLTEANAWSHLVRLFLNRDSKTGLAAMTDANRLTERVWADRSKRYTAAVATGIGVSPDSLWDHVGLAYKALPHMKPEDISGPGFEAAVELLLHRVGGIPQRQILVQKAIEFEGDLETPDLLITDAAGRVHTALLLKWSLRHDRVRQLRTESQACRAAFPGVRVLVGTHETDPARLRLILGNTARFDGLCHVSTDLLDAAFGEPMFPEERGSGRLTNLCGVGV